MFYTVQREKTSSILESLTQYLLGSALSFCFRQNPGWVPWTAYRMERSRIGILYLYFIRHLHFKLHAVADTSIMVLLYTSTFTIITEVPFLNGSVVTFSREEH